MSRTAAEWPSVTVAICCHNSARRIETVLAYLKDQVVPAGLRWEVILIDNDSSDGTAEVAHACWPDDAPAVLRIIREPNRGWSPARDRALREAKYEIISFVDDDNWVDREWLRSSAEAMRDNESLAAAAGLVDPEFGAPPPPWFTHYKSQYAILTRQDLASMPRPVLRLCTAGMSLRMSAWRNLYKDGFRFHVWSRGEDTELCLALVLAGWRLAIEPAIRIRHFIPADRLRWHHLRRLVRQTTAGSVPLDAYGIGLRGRKTGIVAALRRRWWWHLGGMIKQLVRSPIKHLAPLWFGKEGDDAVIDAERWLGRVIGLATLRGKYREVRLEVMAAKWRKLDQLPAPDDRDRSMSRCESR